jgi:hypothetical protein
MSKVEFDKWQTRLHLNHYRIFEANIIHRIFDDAIYDMTEITVRKFKSNNPTTEVTLYTGWNYDSKNTKAIRFNEESQFHPMYIHFFFDEKSQARGYADLREISGKTKDELEHDPIIININTFYINSQTTTFTDIHGNTYDFRSAISGLFAHELTHIKDMFSSDFENILYKIKETSHSQFRDDYKMLGYNNLLFDDEIAEMELLFGLFSDSECRARIEAADKAVMAMPSEILAEATSQYQDRWDKANVLIYNFNKYIGTGCNMLSVIIKNLTKPILSYTKRNIRFMFVFSCFCVEYEYVSGNNVITGTESIRLLYDRNFRLNGDVIEILTSVSNFLEDKFAEYVTNVRDTVADAIDEKRKKDKGIFALFESIERDQVMLKCFFMCPEEYIGCVLRSEPVNEMQELTQEYNNAIPHRISYNANVVNEAYDRGFERTDRLSSLKYIE